MNFTKIKKEIIYVTERKQVINYENSLTIKNVFINVLF